VTGTIVVSRLDGARAVRTPTIDEPRDDVPIDERLIAERHDRRLGVHRQRSDPARGLADDMPRSASRLTDQRIGRPASAARTCDASSRTTTTNSSTAPDERLRTPANDRRPSSGASSLSAPNRRLAPLASRRPAITGSGRVERVAPHAADLARAQAH
jgi:hypothetical protein